MVKLPFGGFKMITDLKCPGRPSRGPVISRVLTGLSGLNILAILIFVGVLIGILLIFEPEAKSSEANLAEGEENRFSSSPFAVAREAEIKEISHGQVLEERLVLLEGNSFLPISNPSNPEFQLAQKIEVVITAYSSSPWETDGDPFITAAGTGVREGIVANNKYPFGTEIRIPEIYGEKIFVVEDRMSWKKGEYHIDIWFPSYWEALNFGAKRTYIEILES